MSTVRTPFADRNNEFALIAEPFLQTDGLPFAAVLNAQTIQRVFEEENALFAQDEENTFSTEIVLWAFLAQCLRDGKGAACSAAVSDVSTYLLQKGQRPPSGDTGDYCRARAKLSLPALQRLVHDAARQLERNADPSWLWKGMHAKLVDGYTFTMPDTPENQAEFPQNPSQVPGVGLPIARACVVLSLATACVCDVAIGPYAGKETGECALLREMWDVFDQGDVALFDRCYCSYMTLALLHNRSVHVCARQHQRRVTDFRRGRRLGDRDHLVTWVRPKCPPWMSRELYAQIPETLTLRELEFDLPAPDRRPESIVVITSLTDAKRYSKQDIAGLYECRWNVELDIRAIKQTLGIDHMRCKSPAMVRRELWVTLLAYNLIRKVIATAAATHQKQPRRLGFTLACQAILSSWMLWSTATVKNAAATRADMLERIAKNEVANRPGRMEPRVLKRRRHRYPLMQQDRNTLRAEPGKQKSPLLI